MSIFIMTGRLSRDAELRTTSAGKEVLSFSLPDERGFGDKKTTLWIDCALWGERAARVEPYLKNGTTVEVHGEISARTYESKGEQKVQLQLFVKELKLHGGKPKEDTPVADNGRATRGQAPVNMDDDIPFSPYR